MNHSVAKDMTAQYLVLDVERLRTYMTDISNTFVDLMSINGRDMRHEATQELVEVTEVTQFVPFGAD